MGWVITVQDWVQIRYLHGSEGMSVRAIAARLGLSRETVSRAVKSGSPPKYVRVRGPSAFDPFEGRVRWLLAGFPAMPATVIAERVGWPGSASWFRELLMVVIRDSQALPDGVSGSMSIRDPLIGQAVEVFADQLAVDRVPSIRASSRHSARPADGAM